MEYVKYRKVTKCRSVIKLLIDQNRIQPYFGTFPEGVDLGSREFRTPQPLTPDDIYVHVCFRYCVWTVSVCFAMPVNMPSTELVSFSMSVSMSRDHVHDLVRCGVSVSGRIRVRDNARYRCCSHVSVSGSDCDRCDVRARGRVRSRLWQCMFPLLFPWQCQWPCDQ